MAVIMTKARQDEYNRIVSRIVDKAWFQKGAIRREMYSLGDKLSEGYPSTRDVGRLLDISQELGDKEIEGDAVRLWNLFEMEDLYPEPTEADYERACMARGGIQ